MPLVTCGKCSLNVANRWVSKYLQNTILLNQIKNLEFNFKIREKDGQGCKFLNCIAKKAQPFDVNLLLPYLTTVKLGYNEHHGTVQICSL